MPEEQAVPIEETPDAPEQEASEGTPSETQAPETDWQDRYENLQPEYTRASQEAAQYRQIIDLARQGDPEALAELGLEAAETDTEEEEYQDPQDERLGRIEQVLYERLQAEQEASEQEEWLSAAEKSVGEQVAALEKQHGKLSEEDVDYLIDLAAFDEQGLPDITTAFERDTARLEAKRQTYLKSKRAPQVQSGASASSQPDLDDPEERRAYLARRSVEAEL